MLRFLSFVSLLSIATTAMATEPSYTYLQVGYQKAELDDVIPGVDIDGDGYGIGGSFELGDSFHVFGAYATTDFDYDLDLEQMHVGVGYHWSMTDSVDLVAEASFVRAEATQPGASTSEDGYGATLGVRGFASEKLELAASVDYVDVGSGSGETSYDGAARYYFMPNFALDLNIGFGDDIKTYGAGLQFYFGK